MNEAPIVQRIGLRRYSTKTLSVVISWFINETFQQTRTLIPPESLATLNTAQRV